MASANIVANDNTAHVHTVATQSATLDLHVSHARLGAIVGVFTGDATRNAMSLARLVQNQYVLLAVSTPDARCHVQLHATGCHARSDVTRLLLVVINALRFVAANVLISGSASLAPLRISRT